MADPAGVLRNLAYWFRMIGELVWAVTAAWLLIRAVAYVLSVV